MSPAGKLLVASLAVGSLAAPMFLLWPEIDLAVAGSLFSPGVGFALQRTPMLRDLSEIVRVASLATAAALVLLLVTRPWLVRWGRALATPALCYLLIVLALGPGLVTNTLLKDQFGRARPREIVEFGGALRFTPALVPSDQCARNCSFVAGDPASGFYLVAFAFALPSLAPWFVAGGLALGALLGLLRIGMGAHFLSDVIFSGVVNCGLAGLLALAFGRRLRPPSAL